MDKDRTRKETSWGSEIPHSSRNNNIDGINPSVPRRILEKRREASKEIPKDSGRSV